MAIADIKIPKDIQSLMQSKEELQRAEDLINALQTLRVQITVNGSTTTVFGQMVISGGAAIIQVVIP